MKKSIVIGILCLMVLFIPQTIYNFSAITISPSNLELADFLTRVSLQTLAVLLVMVILIIILLFKETTNEFHNILLVLLGFVFIGMVILLNLYVTL